MRKLYLYPGIVLFSVVIILFSVFVWPTRYRYDRMNLRGRVVPVRMDRISGKTLILTEEGWISADKLKPPPPPPGPEALPYSQQSDITGRGGLRHSLSGAEFTANLYNDSQWIVTEVIVELRYKDYSRTFKLTGNRMEPLTTSDFSASVDTETILQWQKHKYKNPNWEIKYAIGIPTHQYLVESKALEDAMFGSKKKANPPIKKHKPNLYQRFLARFK